MYDQVKKSWAKQSVALDVRVHLSEAFRSQVSYVKKATASEFLVVRKIFYIPLHLRAFSYSNTEAKFPQSTLSWETRAKL